MIFRKMLKELLFFGRRARFVSLVSLLQYFPVILHLMILLQVRKSTPVCAAAVGRAVFETPPVLGLETMLKMNDGRVVYNR